MKCSRVADQQEHKGVPTGESLRKAARHARHVALAGIRAGGGCPQPLLLDLLGRILDT